MKKFLILGGNMAPIKKVVIKLMMNNIISVGYLYNKALTFECQYGTKKIAVGWYSSLPVQCRGMMELTKTYNPEEYPKYDNYDAIEVSKTKNIPMDYTGLMGVPITFILYINYQQFELVGKFAPILNGKRKFERLIIRRKL